MDDKFWIGPIGPEEVSFRQMLERLLQDSHIVWMLLEHYRECEKTTLPQWVAIKLSEIHAVIDSYASMIDANPSWLRNN